MNGAVSNCAPATLSAEVWEDVFRQTISFAEYQVKRLRWRCQVDGVLPCGYDANSLAAQAVMRFLQKSAAPSRRSSCRIARQENRKSIFVSGMVWQIKRHVLREVTRLHHLKENWIVSNEADLALVGDGDGNLVSPQYAISTSLARLVARLGMLNSDESTPMKISDGQTLLNGRNRKGSLKPGLTKLLQPLFIIAATVVIARLCSGFFGLTNIRASA
jgi:hypothetical protein